MSKKLDSKFWEEFDKTATELVFETPNFEDIITNKFCKNLRNELGITQNVFAHALGVSKKAIEKWEQGRNPISGPTARLLYLINDDYNIFDKIYSANVVKPQEVNVKFAKLEDYLVDIQVPFIQTSKPISYGVSFEAVEPTVTLPENMYKYNIEGGIGCKEKSNCQYSIC